MMKFSEHRLTKIWKRMWDDLFKDNPDHPDCGAFCNHYLSAEADPVFTWHDHAHGLTYQYDLSINQAQVTPAIRPFARAVEDANEALWRHLPPGVFEGPAKWPGVWGAAAERFDTDTMEFLLEQGFDVNTAVSGSNALYHAVEPCGGSFPLVKMLVDAGIDLGTDEWVEYLIQRGADSVTGPGEANTHHWIAEYLRAAVMERRAKGGS